MLPEAVQHAMPYVVLFNFFVVAAVFVGLGTWAGRRELTEVPGGVQNVAEYLLEWFVGQARAMGKSAVTLVAPFIATLFVFILLSNLMALLPLPVVRIPPTSYYSVPLALALTAILGIVVVNAVHRGILPALTHLVWPNPIQLISEVSDVLSLSLRLYGNIGGEFMVALLVAEAAPIGIPVIIHGLGLIPAFIQPLVFTLLTTNFLANAMHHEEKTAKEPAREPTPAGGSVKAAPA